jgi:hypothetical protein
MRLGKAPPVSRFREDDRGEFRPVLPWAQRLAALWTLLWFCGLIAASGPHLVHHLTALPRPADHHTHTDEPRPPDCFLFFLMQHTPVAEDVLTSLPMLLSVGGPSLLQCPLAVHAALWSLVLARAPPV